METTRITDGFFEQFMAAMRELRKSQEETAQQMKETAKRLEETDRMVKETSKQMKETNKRVGGITNRFGEMVEYMILPNLVAKFGELDFTFTKANRTEITDYKHDIITEVDALLENGDTVMVVEIKTKPTSDDIDIILSA